jgi:multisubunit Na+/H+ antiporter MnhE subunit
MTDGIAEPIAWWGALLATYLGLVSSVSFTEIMVGAAAAGVGAAAAVATRRTLLAGLDASWPRAGWLVLLPAQILRDTAVLFGPRVRGRSAEVTVPARQTPAATLVLSTSPGTYVSGISGDRRHLALHRITRRPSPLERKVTGC